MHRFTGTLLRAALMACPAVAPAQIAQNASPPRPATAPSSRELDEEIALALSAAPQPVAELAAVMAYRDGRFVRVREGTNGFICLVERFTGRSTFPTCYDRDASFSFLPGVLLREARVRAGSTLRDAEAAVDSAYRDGRIPPVQRGSIGYRLSPHMSFTAQDGRHISVAPFVMVLAPFATTMDLGYVPTRSREVRSTLELGVSNPGRANAYISFVVPRRDTAQTSGHRTP